MYPIAITVEFHPETGFKRPYELWYAYASGRKRRAASFKTEKAAAKAAEEHREIVRKAAQPGP